MSSFALGLSGFVVLCVLLALRAPIGIAVAITGVGGIAMLKGWNTTLYLLGTVPIEDSQQLCAVDAALVHSHGQRRGARRALETAL